MVDAAALLFLLQVANGGFPTGAFAHSVGFETLIARGDIADATTLEEHVGLWLRFGLAPVDGAAVALAHDAAQVDGIASLATLDETLGGLRLSREAHEASRSTGGAFLRAALAAFGGHRLRSYGDAVRDGVCDGHLATAFGVAAADAGVARGDAVLASLQSSVSSVVAVAARLIPLGQLDVQGVLSHLHGALVDAASRAGTRTLEDLSGAMAILDIASMQHERLAVRLCIS